MYLNLNLEIDLGQWSFEVGAIEIGGAGAVLSMRRLDRWRRFAEFPLQPRCGYATVIRFRVGISGAVGCVPAASELATQRRAEQRPAFAFHRCVRCQLGVAVPCQFLASAQLRIEDDEFRPQFGRGLSLFSKRVFIHWSTDAISVVVHRVHYDFSG